MEIEDTKKDKELNYKCKSIYILNYLKEELNVS